MLDAMHTDIQKEIQYRAELKNKYSLGQRLTPEELFWWETHRAYNEKLGYPYICVDMIKLEPKRTYDVKVTFISSTQPGKTYPILSMPAGKGSIISSERLFDSYGQEKKPGTPVKTLLCSINESFQEESVVLCSDTGMFSVDYKGEYYNPRHHRAQGMSSDMDNIHFAMLREDINRSKVLYRCKDPNSDCYGALVFTVEWELKGRGNGPVC